jgi:hypothetical protein
VLLVIGSDKFDDLLRAWAQSDIFLSYCVHRVQAHHLREVHLLGYLALVNAARLRSESEDDEVCGESRLPVQFRVKGLLDRLTKVSVSA